MIHTIRHLTHYLACCCVLGVLVLPPMLPAADQAPGLPPRAEIIAVEGEATTYQVEGMHGQTVTVDVPSNNVANVRMSDTRQRTVQGKVVAIDGESHRVKVHTQEGQIIVLALPPDTLKDMRLGDIFVLAVAQPGSR
ncbi:MAG: hypothetical protein AB7N91_16560 [Candidatus Tectimicrobiota bacterium]